ncbi:MFS transporter, partial [Staphylococcus aureus]|uniref:MFS transporter n=2 Tax=Bacteria TaxID=2 RepID=UPI00123E73AD
MTDVQTNADAAASAAHQPMGFAEFVLTIAAVMALNPLAMDMMLPALPNIGAAFAVADGNHLQAVLALFLTGFGAGQLIMGPLADRFGRRPILIGGLTLYA